MERVMQDHGQSRRKNKRKHMGIVKVFAIVCVIWCLVFVVIRYQKWRKEMHSRQTWLETVLIGEKNWILENQGKEGELYMNGSKAGDVNPYFSCMAALGLLAETKDCPVGDKEKEAVSRYLNWHTRVLLETDGKMGIYRKEGTELVYVEKADSEDGYLGIYLFLLGKYLKKAGSAEKLENWQEGIDVALDRIQLLLKDGTTQVSQENPTIYLMDNLEVWKGLVVLESVDLVKTERITKMRKTIQEKIETEFWNEDNQRWRIIRGSDAYDPENFYPDGIAQVYPLIFEFPAEEEKEQEALYQQFTEKFQWQEMNRKREGFAWAMTGMAAAQLGDGDNLMELIRNYKTEYSRSRKYPLYTGEAGWICRECEELYKLYERQLWPF